MRRVSVKISPFLCSSFSDFWFTFGTGAVTTVVSSLSQLNLFVDDAVSSNKSFT